MYSNVIKNLSSANDTMSGERAWIILGPDCYDSPGLSGIDDTLSI